MDAIRMEQMLMLARELAYSHGTFFAAALLAELGFPLQAALEALTRQTIREIRSQPLISLRSSTWYYEKRTA